MATNHTKYFSLSQWVPEDPFIRTDFNEDHAKIDAALQSLKQSKAEKAALSSLESGKADQSDLTALQEEVSDLSGAVTLRCRMKAGIYKGNGNKSQFIEVGFPVMAVLIENAQGSRNESSNSSTSGGLAVKGGSVYHGTTLVSVSGSGFTVYNGGQYQGAFNNSGGSYHYIAWG